jgi:hypothetical protein
LWFNGSETRFGDGPESISPEIRTFSIRFGKRQTLFALITEVDFPDLRQISLEMMVTDRQFRSMARSGNSQEIGGHVHALGKSKIERDDW